MTKVMEFLITQAYAQQFTSVCPEDSGTVPSNLGRSRYFQGLCPVTNNNVTLGQLVDNIITIILFLAGALAVIYLLWAGIQYITAGGDETRAAKARAGIINAIIGIIIIVLAFVIEKAAARLFT